MKNINVTAGLKARSFSGLNKITTNGNSVTWIPQEEAGQYVKTETLRATKNGTYTPPQGVYYDRVIVKVRKKDRKAVSGDAPETVTPEATKVSVNVSKVRTGMSFPNVEKITTPGTNGDTVTWVQENQAYVYAKTESLNATDNDTYEPSEGAFFKQVTVNVTGEQEDDLDDNGTGTGGTGEAVKAYSRVTVNVPQIGSKEGLIDYVIDNDTIINRPYVKMNGKQRDIGVLYVDQITKDKSAKGFFSIKVDVHLNEKGRTKLYGYSFPDLGEEIPAYNYLVNTYRRSGLYQELKKFRDEGYDKNDITKRRSE